MRGPVLKGNPRTFVHGDDDSQTTSFLLFRETLTRKLARRHGNAANAATPPDSPCTTSARALLARVLKSSSHPDSTEKPTEGREGVLAAAPGEDDLAGLSRELTVQETQPGSSAVPGDTPSGMSSYEVREADEEGEHKE